MNYLFFFPSEEPYEADITSFGMKIAKAKV